MTATTSHSPTRAGRPQEAAGVGPGAFRAAMRHHAKGVAIITAGSRTPVGLCATSFTSVSLDPPLVSFTVGLRSSSWPTIEAAAQVMVHLLAENQEALARLFALSGAAKFGPGTRWHRGARGLPVLDDVLAALLVEPVQLLPVGDHALVLGRVAEAVHTAGGRPLLHHDGEFARLARP